MADAQEFQELRIGPGEHVRARLWEAAQARAGVVMVGGVGGGFDTPAQGLYPRLGRHLSSHGVVALQVAFRLPGELGEAVLDAGAGVRFLSRLGCDRVALVGHSFGGAVAIRAGVALPEVVAVVTLATQSYGTDRVRDLAGRPVLLVHGVEDDLLPADCSAQVFDRSGEPKELRLIPGAGHGLDEAADEVYRIVHGFLAQHLVEGSAAHAR
jgi:alpha-beta hydrolase superfamily lysophospholipase